MQYCTKFYIEFLIKIHLGTADRLPEIEIVRSRPSIWVDRTTATWIMVDHYGIMSDDSGNYWGVVGELKTTRILPEIPEIEPGSV